MGRNCHWSAQPIRVNIQRQITFHDNIHTWGQFRKKLLNADIVECGRKLERTQHANSAQEVQSVYLWESNPGPSCCVVTALTITPLWHLCDKKMAAVLSNC